MKSSKSFSLGTDPEIFLDNIAERVSIAEGSVGIREILLRLFRNQHINNKQLSQLTEIPVPVLSAARNELIKAGLLLNKTEFTPVGKIWARKKLGFFYESEIISNDLFTQFKLKKIPKFLFPSSSLQELERWIKNRPDPAFELDQSRATFETQLKRVLLLLRNGDIEGQKILFVGDDDATSLLISAMNLSCELVVLDIDTRILSFLSSASESLDGTPIQTIHHDLRHPLPDSFSHSFNVVFTDPPYTLSGARLFFQRGAEGLKHLQNKIYLSFGIKESDLIRQLQVICINAGFQIWDIKRGFNKYLGNSRLGQFSHLFIFKLVELPAKPILYFPLSYTGKIYTAEFKGRLNSDQIIDSDLQTRPIGYHLVEEFYDLDPASNWMNNSQQLHDLLVKACLDAELTIIDSFRHSYPPYGASIIIVLSESHISLHTWPEHQYISIDIFICDDSMKAHKVVETLKKYLKPGRVEELKIFRGQKSIQE